MTYDSPARPGFAQRFGHYLSLIKFSHTVFALPFAMVGFTLGVGARHSDMAGPAAGNQGLLLLFFQVLLCMIFARSAAMAFNRWLDRRYDALNPRTAKREIPAGVIGAKSALLFTILCCIAFMAVTATINRMVLALSPVALGVILFYSYTKRFTALCHVVLGLGLSLSPIGAYLCLHPHFDLVPVLFSCIVLTWTAGFDIIYALQDIEFDRSLKLHSIPAALGLKGALTVSTLLHVLTAALVVTAGIYGEFNFFYWIGAAIFTGLLLYQHLIVKPSDLSRVGIAFANTNGAASIIFAVFTITALCVHYFA
jgi:4-hydroxybenzoate polyprenyltransferase